MELDNLFYVGLRGAEVTVLGTGRLLSGSIKPTEALNLAAWLVAMAEIADGSLIDKFPEYLEAAKSS